MKRLAVFYIVLQVALIGLMPPGLCSCWLLPNVEENHPHVTTTRHGHSHEYLAKLFPGAGSMVTLDVRLSERFDPRVEVSGGILRALFEHVFFGRLSPYSPPLPPPKV